MMTVGCYRNMKTNHHLVPPLILSEVLWEACDIAFGQPFKFSQQRLPLVHSHKTLDPKHNLDLYLEGEHPAKRLVLGIDQPFVFHVDE